MKCFIVAARTCTPTVIHVSPKPAPLPFLSGLIVGGTATATLAPTNSKGICNYTMKTNTIHVTLSAQGKRAAQERGMTQTQIQTLVDRKSVV